MTDAPTEKFPPQAPAAPPVPPRQPKWKRWALPTGALVLGLVLGGAGGGDPTASEEYRALQAELGAAENQIQAAESRATEAEDRATKAEDRASAAEEAASRAASDSEAGAVNDDAAVGAQAPPSSSAESSGGVNFSMPNLVGMDLQSAQNAIQSNGVFFSTSHDLLGDRAQVLDSNWKVCSQNVPAGQQVTGDAEGRIDLGVVKREEACP